MSTFVAKLDYPELNGLQLRLVSKSDEWAPTTSGINFVKQFGGVSEDFKIDWENFIIATLDGTLVENGSILAMKIIERDVVFRVCSERGLVRTHTKVTLLAKQEVVTRSVFEKEFKTLHEFLDVGLFQHCIFNKLELVISKLLVIIGNIGAGKNHLLRSVCCDLQIPFQYCHVSDIIAEMSQNVDDGKDFLIELSDRARLFSPSVLVIDELELLQEGVRLLSDMDRNLCLNVFREQIGKLIHEKIPVCVVSLVKRKLDSELKLVFGERNIEIPVPNIGQREKILNLLVSAEYSRVLAQHTPGFSPKALSLLVRNSSIETIPNTTKTKIEVELCELIQSLEQFHIEDQDIEIKTNNLVYPDLRVQPKTNKLECMLGIAQETVGSWNVGFKVGKKNISWEDVAGYESIKKKLRRLIVSPIESPELLQRLGVRAPAGVLLYGPSGCGKTLLVNALGAIAPMNFITVKGDQIFSKYLGDSEASIRNLFTVARQLAPCLVFLDHIDVLAVRRGAQDSTTSGGVNERVLSTLLNELDGIQERSGVVVIACTTKPHKIDEAMLRPGRLEQHVYIPPPSLLDRKEILESFARRKTLVDSAIDFFKIAKETDQYSCADLISLIREAGVFAVRTSTSPYTCEMINEIHFRAAMMSAMRISKIDENLKHGKDENDFDQSSSWTSNGYSENFPFENSFEYQNSDQEEMSQDAKILLNRFRGQNTTFWWPGIDQGQISALEEFRQGRKQIQN
ncbi:Cell division control protein 48 B [Nowakowskiella sp. JEL0078]|nr:Cell division control protein 48 B [Nowakowskiella sp. JEL0078]